MELKCLKWLIQFLFLMGATFSQGIGEPANPISYGLIGQVVEASGNVMPGVTIWAISIEGRTINATGAINTSTNITGYYGFDLPPGNYTIMGELPGYSFTASTARVWTGNTTIAQPITGYAAGTQFPSTVQQTAIQPQVVNQSIAAQFYTGIINEGMGWVEGRIVSQSGAPISMASITVDGIRTSATSNEQGYYRIALNPGLHRIDADRMGYGIPPRVVPVFTGQTSILDLFGKGTAVLGTMR